MRLRAALLAVLALGAHPAQQAAAIGGNRYTTPQIVKYAETGRVPFNVTPPGGVQPGYQIELYNAVKAAPADDVYKALKGGAFRTNAINVAKGGARLIGYGGLMQVGAIAVNAGFNWLYNQVKSGAMPQNTLSNCFQVADNNNYALGLGMPCNINVSSTVLTFPHGEYPKSFGQTVTWWNHTVDGQGYYWQVENRESAGFRLNTRCPAKPNDPTKPGLFIPGYEYSMSQIEDFYQQYLSVCEAPSKVSKDPITLDDYIKGTTVNGTVIPPHPELKTQIRDGLAEYFKSVPANPDPTQEFYPGVTFINPPTINQWYGYPVNNEEDLDGDRWTDAEEIGRGSNPEDADSVPDPNRDTDGDGVPDAVEDKLKTNPYDPRSTPTEDQLRDMDGDGILDSEDPDIDGDGIPNAEDSAPEDAAKGDLDGDGVGDLVDPDKDGDGVRNEDDAAPEDAAIPVKCATGQKASTDGKSCVPEEEEAKCPEGQKPDESTPPKCVPDTDPKDPVEDECGDMSITRMMAHTRNWVRDWVVPCERLGDIFKPLMEKAEGRYPFAMVSAFNSGVIKVPGSGDRAAALPDTLGPFTLDWSWLTPLITIVGLLFKGFTSWVAVDLVLSRLMGQVVVK